MTGYTKLFGSILDSTIWRESNETRLLWITMLAMAGKSSVVEASIPGLADRARLTLPQTEAALATLLAPDPYSRTKESEGRRIEAVDGGWIILNHAKYRAKMSQEDRAIYMQKYRQEGRDKSRRGKQVVTNGNSGKQNVTPVRQSESESESESGKGSARAVEVGSPGTGEIPNWEEVLENANRLGVTEASARKFFDHHQSENLWRNKHDRLIDWRHKLVRWQTDDRARGNGALATAKSALPAWRQIQNLEKQILEHPANRESLSNDGTATPEQKTELRALRAKLEELNRVE